MIRGRKIISLDCDLTKQIIRQTLTRNPDSLKGFEKLFDGNLDFSDIVKSYFSVDDSIENLAEMIGVNYKCSHRDSYDLTDDMFRFLIRLNHIINIKTSYSMLE